MKKTRSRIPIDPVTMNDLFWKSLPDRKLKPRMKKVVCDYLDELEFNG